MWRAVTPSDTKPDHIRFVHSHLWNVPGHALSRWWQCPNVVWTGLGKYDNIVHLNPYREKDFWITTCFYRSGTEKIFYLSLGYHEADSKINAAKRHCSKAPEFGVDRVGPPSHRSLILETSSKIWKFNFSWDNELETDGTSQASLGDWIAIQ